MRHFRQSFGESLGQSFGESFRAQRPRISLGVAAIIAALGATITASMTAAMRQQTPADPAATGQAIMYVDDDAPPLPQGDGRSWRRAFRSLQDALDAALASDGTVTEIRIAGGVYRPDQGANVTPGDRYAVFNAVDGVALRGGYRGAYGAPANARTTLATPLDPDHRDLAAYESILSGDLLGDDGPNPWQNYGDNALILVNVIGVRAVIDGLTFTAKNWSDPGNLDDYGAIHADQAHVEVSHCTFNWNQAYVAGALYLDEGRATFTNCNFQHNRGFHAAVIKSVRSSLSLSECSFQTNSTVAHDGGAISTGGGANSLMARDCDFIANDAENDGGALYLSRSSGLVLRCRFIGNGGDYGGAIRDISGFGNPRDLRFSQCVFSNNSAGTRGGAIDLVNQSAQFDRCTFLENFCSSQGGAAIVGGGNFGNCAFLGNVCGGVENGGAFRIIHDTHLTNCVFSGNDSWGPGGACFIESNTHATISNSTFANNVSLAGSAAIFGPAAVANCIAWNLVSPPAGYAAQVQFVDATAVEYSCVQQAWPGEGNLSVDPLFANAAGADGIVGTGDDDLRLTRQSRCIDSGQVALLPPDWFDLDADGIVREQIPFDLSMWPRVVARGLDIGAYEVQH